jgi:hypothetical protein
MSTSKRRNAVVGLSVATFALIMGAAAPKAHASGPATAIKLSWLGTCDAGRTVTLTINGAAAGSYTDPANDCTCGPTIRSKTITDPAILALVGAPGCTSVSATVSAPGYIAWISTEIDRGSDAESSCLFAFSGNSCGNSYLCAGYTYLNSATTYTNQLPDSNGNGVPDCTDPDIDGDGILNAADNCPNKINPDQADSDHDGAGDVCDNCAGVSNPDQADSDGDGLGNVCDNCPAASNKNQADCNHDGVGDVCEADTSKQDTDADGLCNGVDNCPGLSTSNHADCNGNGVGDACEASWANRDDDGDSVCNGTDNCPVESNAAQTDADANGVGDICDMQAITVPWQPSNVTVPHSTYTGATTTLKGIARYGGDQFMWDYGDGSAPMPWTAIGNPYNLGVQHAYSGSVGQLFFATLSVRSSSNPGVVARATYPIKIEQSGPLPGNGQMDPNEMNVRINMSIDEGLWYLHVTQNRSTYGDGVPGYRQAYGYWSGVVAGTCAAVDAFELHGSKPNKSYSTDPYVETVQRGINWMLASNAVVSAISAQQYGNPDTNGNGTGIYIGANDTYTNGVCAVSFASSGAPARQSLVGPGTVYARNYQDVVQDLVDWFAYGQSDGTSWGRGGWHYNANAGDADGSTNQWPILAMAAAEDNMSSTVPTFVRQEIPYFLNYVHHTAADGYNGGWGYTSPDQWLNVAKTAGGMLAHYFEGDSVSHPDVQAGIGFMYRRWGLNTDGWGEYSSGNSYAMYGIMKAMRKPQPNILRLVEYDYVNHQQTANSFDWYYTPIGQSQEGLATNLVRRQQANGSWSDTFGNNAQSGALAAGWDVLILQKGVTTIPPEAKICNCEVAVWDQNQDVTLSGSCSSDADINRHIVNYEWDFEYNGSSFNTAATGVTVTKVGGYPNYATHVVGLRVTDDNPLALGGAQTSIATCNVKITPPPICPHPSAGGPYLGFNNVPLHLDASGSFDPDHDPLTYAWDLDNDGKFGTDDHDCFGQPSDGVGATPTFTFPASLADLGPQPIAVKVTDDPANNPLPYQANSCSEVAFSTVEIGNHAPVSSPGGPYLAKPGSTITLDGTGSSDVDGDTLTYAWDLTGSGLFNDSAAAKPTFTVGGVVGTQYSVCLKVSDPAGKNNTRCTTVTVTKLNTPPTCEILSPNVVASCTGGALPVVIDGTRSADADNDALTYAWTTNCDGAFDNSGAAMTTLTVQTANQGCTKGCTAHLTVSDGQASSSCDAAITINDTTNPTFPHPPQDLTLECGPGTNQALLAWLGDAPAADACDAVAVSSDFAGLAGGCGNGTGSAHVTWTAVDDCTNSGQTSATITVKDTTAPAVACPAPVSTECTGASTMVALSASASDVCSGGLSPTGPASDTYPVGTKTVTFAATDSCGNTASCSTTVTVTDTGRPSISCPGDTAAECTGNHQAQVTPAPATATDLCGPASVANPAAGAYPLGTTAVVYSAADGSGNSASCSANVRVLDTTPPTIHCPGNVTAECTGAGSATLASGAATASDVCGTATVSDPAPATYPLGTTPVTHVASDEAGLGASCQNTVTVVDTTPPSITCPANVKAECNASRSATGVSAGASTASDACGAVSLSDPAAATYPLGTTPVTHQATDGAGLGASCSNTVTVVDTKAPVITCPATVTAECNAPSSATGVSAGSATATELCTTATITNPASATYPLGTSSATHTAKDEAGNSASCTNSVVVVDTKGPVFDAASLAAQTVVGNCTGVALTFKLPTAKDVCQSAVVSCGALAGTKWGANVVTCTATDPSGNKTTASLTVNVLEPVRVIVTAPLGDDDDSDESNGTHRSCDERREGEREKAEAEHRPTDDDSYIFKVGQVVPHKVRLFSCSWVDVTKTRSVSVHLDESLWTISVGVPVLIKDLPEAFAGVGDAGGKMVLVGGHYQYNLQTNAANYPAGTENDNRFFRGAISVAYTASPGYVVGYASTRLESR